MGNGKVGGKYRALVRHVFNRFFYAFSQGWSGLLPGYAVHQKSAERFFCWRVVVVGGWRFGGRVEEKGEVGQVILGIFHCSGEGTDSVVG